MLFESNSILGTLTEPLFLSLPSNIDGANQLNIPQKYRLAQNFPNPFNPTTTIKFELPSDSHINLSIYDIQGNLIKTLVNEKKDAGYHSVIWNGKDQQNKDVSSGVYFYRIESKDFTDTKKCLLVK